jgi:hypothetical protein
MVLFLCLLIENNQIKYEEHVWKLLKKKLVAEIIETSIQSGLCLMQVKQKPTKPVVRIALEAICSSPLINHLRKLINSIGRLASFLMRVLISSPAAKG